MSKKKCPWHKKCRNGNDGCYIREPKNCVRFMPLDGTNLNGIEGVVETPPNIDDEKFSQFFMNWIESMGWNFNGIIGEYNDNEDECV